MKDTVATLSNPGVSVAVANEADARPPAVIASVDIELVVSTFLSAESRVVTATLFPATTDDGVLTFVIVKLYCVFCAIFALAMVIAKMRVP